MRTQADIDKLKRSWLADPSWDIENTDGFEAHRGELLKYRQFVEMENLARREMDIQVGMASYECSRGTFLVIEQLTRRLDAADRRIGELENSLGLSVRP